MLYPRSQKLGSLVIVAAISAKFMKAIEGPTSFEDVVQLQVKRSPRAEHCGSAMTSTSTVAASSLNPVVSFTTPKHLSKRLRLLWGKSKTPYSASTTSLAEEKKVQIRKQLEANREKIMEMNGEYRSLLQAVTELKKQISWQVKKRCKTTGSRFISTTLRKLERYHKRVIWELVEDRVCELGGIRSRITEFESVPHPNSQSDSLSKKAAQAFPFVSSFWEAVKPSKSGVKIVKDSPSSASGGSLFEKAERSGVHSEGSHYSRPLEHMNSGRQHWSPPKRMDKKKVDESLAPSTIVTGDPVRLIIEKGNCGMVHDLREILHSLTFQIRPFAFDHHDALFQKKMTRIKVGFERCVFRALAFLYKFEFIKKVEVNTFFESAETLELTARHLAHLFLNLEYPLSTYHVLIPDINFIMDDWHTEHLRSLKVLETEKQGSLLYMIIEWARGAQYQDFSTLVRHDKFRFLLKSNLLNDIKKWSPKPLNENTKKPHYDSTRENLKKMVVLFQQFPISENDQKPEHFEHRFAFLLNFHILNFVKTYGNDNVKAFIDAYANRDKDSRILNEIYGVEEAKKLKNTNSEGAFFEIQFNLIKLGLELHHFSNKKNDYRFFLEYPEKYSKFIPEQVSRKSLKDIYVKMRMTRGGYLEIWDQIDLISKRNDYLRTWTKKEPVKTILHIFSDTAMVTNPKNKHNLWLKSVSCAEILPFNESECKNLAHHLVSNYNVFERYHEVSRSIEEDLESIFLKRLTIENQMIQN